MIEIDGSRGEGGGQVLRTALALSAWLGRPFTLTGIRARRPQPGLKAQHLAAVRVLAEICGAAVDGAAPGSGTLAFRPGRVRPGRYEHDVGTAGATTLVAQAAALPLLRAPGGSRLEIRGGTHVAWSPPADHLRDVFAPFLARLGLDLRVTVERPGFYPRGGGLLRAETAGSPGEDRAAPARLALERPPRHQIRVATTATVCALPRSIAERMIATVGRALGARHWRMRDHVVELEGPPGAFVFIRVFAPGGEDGPCVLGGFTGLGEPRKPAELVAEEAVAEALAFLGSDADLDCRLADQVLLPALLAGRDLAFRTDRVTEHLRTQAATIGHFLGPCVRVGADGRVEVRPPQAATARGG